MDSKDEALAKLDNDYRQKRAEIETKYLLLQDLPPELRGYDWRPHIYKLYDRVGTLALSPNRYESLRNGMPDPTLDTARQLAAALPARAPVCLFRDGSSVSVRTSADAARALDKRPDATVTPIAPLWITVQPSSYDQTIDLQWITEIGVGLVECSIKLPLYSDTARKLGSLRLEFEHYSGDGEVSSVRRNEFTIAPAVSVLKNAKAGAIRYASGDHKTPGHHLIYWDSADGEHADLTVDEILAALA